MAEHSQSTEDARLTPKEVLSLVQGLERDTLNNWRRRGYIEARREMRGEKPYYSYDVEAIEKLRRMVALCAEGFAAKDSAKIASSWNRWLETRRAYEREFLQNLRIAVDAELRQQSSQQAAQPVSSVLSDSDRLMILLDMPHEVTHSLLSVAYRNKVLSQPRFMRRAAEGRVNLRAVQLAAEVLVDVSRRLVLEPDSGSSSPEDSRLRDDVMEALEAVIRRWQREKDS